MLEEERENEERKAQEAMKAEKQEKAKTEKKRRLPRVSFRRSRKDTSPAYNNK